VNASGHFCGIAEMLTPVKYVSELAIPWTNLCSSLTIPEAARFGPQTNGRVSSKWDGYLSETFPTRHCVTSSFCMFYDEGSNSEHWCFLFRNTQERKPVTNSRDTQELLPEAGQEMLRIFHSHLARTSLLQDFGFYEVRVYYNGTTRN
jgi:hypothetical protein